MNKLWTRDFTIITIGTIVSMLGNSIAGFAISLLVLDYTESTLLYTLFLVIYNLPKLVMPMVVGPYLDNFSRKKVIYAMDFLCAAIFVGVYFVLKAGFFHYGAFSILAAALGGINSIYQVAYESFYPTLIPEGNYRKAYSISSLMIPLSAAMLPVASYIYEIVGLEPLFLLNAAAFFIAAIFETQIKAEETHVHSTAARFDFKQYCIDFKEGVRYIFAEKGLLIITVYFFLNNLTGSGTEALYLPWFKSTPRLGVMKYTYITTSALIGRLVACGIHYRRDLPAKWKFDLVIWCYIIYGTIQATMLFVPVGIMMPMNFLMGLVGISSYNIRISATQNYVPDSHRGRFNGVFQMFCNLGSVFSQLIAGAMSEVMNERTIILILMSFNLFFVFTVMLRGRDHVKPIYNKEL